MKLSNVNYTNLSNADYLSVGELIEKLKELPPWYLVRFQERNLLPDEVSFSNRDSTFDILKSLEWNDSFCEDCMRCEDCDKIDPSDCNRECEFADFSCKKADKCPDFQLKTF